MGKYKAKGGAMGGFMIGFIILIIAGGLIGLTVWLIMKNTPPATCDVSVTDVNVAQSPVNGQYPVTIRYSGNGSNACTNANVTVTGTLTSTTATGNSVPVNATEPLSQGTIVVQATDPNSKVALTYFIVNPDGSQGPHHTYP